MSSTSNVGIILPNKIYKNMRKVSPNVKCMFSLLESAAERNNIRLCFLTLGRIRPDQKTVLAYVKQDDHYVLREVRRPKVVYSRILDYLPKHQAHIKALIESGVTVFNRPNYDVEKYTVHQLLEKKKYFHTHLPTTKPLTFKTLQLMMKQFDSLIMKPNYGERGIGAMKLDRNGKYWRLSYKVEGDLEVKHEYFHKQIPDILVNRMRKRRYIIQETIPLATYKGNPFDMRVSVQKNKEGEFVVTGIMCKVAKHKDYLTNGSQGSTTYRLHDIYDYTNIETTPLKLRRNIQSLALSLAYFLDDYYPHLADLGFDIGVTKEGVPYFIECNFISDYLGGIIDEGRLLAEEWSKIFTTPIDYAKYLLEKME
ncbi:hypothetical protein FZW96_15065 [Bacillus sp. BGMRC 2118]|nr:hypothetical protein FZW96_15065 [Bacillus sp. BGMRC 2118]